jgi:hypothetical protein
MGFTFGGFIVQYSTPLAVPRTGDEQPHDPLGNEDDHDTSRDLLLALYDGKVHRLDDTIEVELASSRDARGKSVAFYGRSIIVFDRFGALDSNFEESGLYELDEDLATFSARPEVARAMVFSLDSTSEAYAFAVFSGGARTRRWCMIPTDRAPIHVDEGAPLADEPQGDAHGEDRINGAARTLLGDTDLTTFITDFDGAVFKCAR